MPSGFADRRPKRPSGAKTPGHHAAEWFVRYALRHPVDVRYHALAYHAACGDVTGNPPAAALSNLDGDWARNAEAASAVLVDALAGPGAEGFTLAQFARFFRLHDPRLGPLMAEDRYRRWELRMGNLDTPLQTP